jgi:hypothetical protein
LAIRALPSALCALPIFVKVIDPIGATAFVSALYLRLPHKSATARREYNEKVVAALNQEQTALAPSIFRWEKTLTDGSHFAPGAIF